MWCENCGVSAEKERLFDVLSFKEKGIIKLCGKCVKDLGFPILRRPTTFQLKEAEKKGSYYERVAAKRKETEKPASGLTSQEIGLKEIVNRNYLEKVPKEKKPRPDLIENFHWVIMRLRRLKKLTQEQLGKAIGESESAIKMAEKGILPEDDYRLIRKLEGFFSINLIKDKSKAKTIPEKMPARILKFDPEAMEKIKIADLQRLQAEKEDIEMGFILEEGEESDN